jgi:hypothetical protein
MADVSILSRDCTGRSCGEAGILLCDGSTLVTALSHGAVETLDVR